MKPETLQLLDELKIKCKEINHLCYDILKSEKNISIQTVGSVEYNTDSLFFPLPENKEEFRLPIVRVVNHF